MLLHKIISHTSLQIQMSSGKILHKRNFMRTQTLKNYKQHCPWSPSQYLNLNPRLDAHEDDDDNDDDNDDDDEDDDDDLPVDKTIGFCASRDGGTWGGYNILSFHNFIVGEQLVHDLDAIV